MNLSGLLTPIEESPEVLALMARLGKGRPSNAVITDSAKTALMAAVARQHGGCVLILTSRPDKAQRLQEEIAVWLGDERAICLFPEREPIPYERLVPDRGSVRGRLTALERLLSGKDGLFVIISSPLAMAQRTLTRNELTEATLHLTVGEQLETSDLMEKLVGMGYEVAPVVEEHGQASRRGGILDIFPATSEEPIRIELFGNRIDSMRSFNPIDQRSSGRIEWAVIGPAREVLMPSSEGRTLKERIDCAHCQPQVRERYEGELAKLAEGMTFPGFDFYVPFLANGNVFEHLPEHTLVILNEPGEVRSNLETLSEQAKDIHDDLVRQGELPKGLPSPHLPVQDLLEAIEKFERRLELSRWAVLPDMEELPFSALPAFGGRLRTLASDIGQMLQDGQRLVVVSQQVDRLSDLLEEQGISVTKGEKVAELPLPDRPYLIRGSLPAGFRLNDDGLILNVLTDTEVFGFTKQRRTPPRRRFNREAFLAELSVGDYVVHIDHGIARFAGLVRKSFNDREGEYLELHYAEGDKLFLPTDQLDRISRYVGPADHPPALTRLSSQEWARTKERVRRATAELARELLNLYAAREMLKCHTYSADTPWQQELEAAFPYVETADQLTAIRDVKADMERARPMDRLVCGDVGYGKTEIAIRAAFKALMDGRQVAVLVPTTVLAQQHGRTFSERLAGFPIRVEVLSRFRSEQEQRRIVADLAAGSVDIIIGTHRLLSNDVQFKDLGLLIIDEEQRFGVAHKEQLKRLRQDVDVLTLSATPIPRTLYMALGGIRDVSTMETPPEERLPIKTYVAQSDDRLIREAILREMERGGQVYFVHNRVQSIGHIAQRLEDIVPEARFTVAHGQMPEHQLEQAMLEFADDRSDVLVCTTIIESGLDIPNVNTIIINQANRLGLAQLYQLRGRVGRGAERAYGYLLYDRNARLTPAAQKRLQTIFEATELGAGFQIALRDLEIRGAGNLLGPEQSGHMAAVGLDLYTRLLAEQVERMRALRQGETPKTAATPQVSLNLPIAAYIPDEYIADLNQRLALYQRMASLTEIAQVNDMEKEMDDRFGPPPPLVLNLLYAMAIRVLSQQAGVEAVGLEEDQIVIRLTSGRVLPMEKLRRELTSKALVGRTQIRIEYREGDYRWRDRLLEVLERLAAESGVAA